MTVVSDDLVTPGLGTGIYTIGEAAHLVKVNATRLRRWVQGYQYARRNEVRASAPILDRRAANPGLLTFFEIVEMCFVREFIKAGVKLPEIRDAAERLRGEWKTPYPFALDRLQTDGCQLLLKSGEHYRSVATCQQVFDFAREFFKDIDVVDHLAVAWWPLGRDRLIIIDPKRSFGAPIDVRSGVRTDVLHRAYLAEQDFASAADWYDVTVEAVKDAVEFESQWLKAA